MCSKAAVRAGACCLWRNPEPVPKVKCANGRKGAESLDYRGFSCQLAGHALYQWFCLIDALDAVLVPSKSELQRFAHLLSEAEMRAIHDGLLRTGVEHPKKLALKETLDLEAYAGSGGVFCG